MIGRIIRRILLAFVAIMGIAAIAAVVAKRTVVSAGGPDSDEIELAAIFDSVDLESQATSGADRCCAGSAAGPSTCAGPRSIPPAPT